MPTFFSAISNVVQIRLGRLQSVVPTINRTVEYNYTNKLDVVFTAKLLYD
jgi:hypothetical protein